MPKQPETHGSNDNAFDPRAHAIERTLEIMLLAKHAIDAAFHLAAIVEFSDDAIIGKDLKGVIKTWNNGAERMCCYREEEGVDRSIAILIPPELADEERRVLQEIAAGNPIKHYETARRRKDGSYVDISLTVSPVKDASGRVTGASSVARDISQQRRDREFLRRSEELMRVTLSSIGDAVIATDRDGRVTFMNAEAERLTGWRQHEAAGDPLEKSFKIMNEFSREPVADPVTKVLRTGAVTDLGNHTTLIAKDGTERPIDDSAAPIRDTGGELIGVVLVFRDVSEHRLRQAVTQRLAAIVESSSDAIYSTSLPQDEGSDGIVQHWNRGATALYGYAAQEIIGQPITLLMPPDLLSEDREAIARLRNGESIEPYETRRLTKGGREVDVSVSLSPLTDAQGSLVGVSRIARDITARKQADDVLRHTASHDALTDLPNRTTFLELLADALLRAKRDPGRRVAALLLDLDGFKAVNDTLGHAAGDRLLAEIALRLRTCVRPGDIVARLGGDEFTILLDDVTGVPDVEHAAQRIQDALAAPITFQDREIVPTASIGAALSEADHAKPQDLLRPADLAMYHAKQQGGARLQVFDTTLRELAQARLDMQTDLQGAVARGELRLAFQPILEFDTGRVFALEALLRWHHPARGVIMPLDFLPLAEDTGLIMPIGAWVVQEACRRARGWQDAFPEAAPVRVCVNLSGKQLRHVRIVQDVRTALDDAGIPGSSLILEISESVVTQNVDSAVVLLHRVREMGVELHVDNFGTGHSSLTELPHLPLQGIKVDRSFVRQIGARRTDVDIVRSIVEMGHTLGLRVIAQGVDTIVQRERLIALRCELGQGDIFAKPLEASAVDAFLLEANKAGKATA
jgi:diguanylate cyclase (GGDEF)-like protein/PAS domain S-box-containing protein